VIARMLSLALVLLALATAPARAELAPRYSVYVQHFPQPSNSPAGQDPSCPLTQDGKFLSGAYRAQIVFFPTEGQKATVTDGKPLGERLSRLWGALGIAWAVDTAGAVTTLVSLSAPALNEASAEIKPPLAPPLWAQQTVKGSPPPLPPMLETIFRPLLPQGSSVNSADLLKLFCGTDTRSDTSTTLLIRIHRILAQQSFSAEDFAVVRDFLVPDQSGSGIEAWGALLDKVRSANPTGFVFADYLGDKVLSRHQALYGRFADNVRKAAGAGGPAPTPSAEEGNPRPAGASPPPSVDPSANLSIDRFILAGSLVLAVLGAGAIALMYSLRVRARSQVEECDSPLGVLERRVIDLEGNYQSILRTIFSLSEESRASRHNEKQKSNEELSDLRNALNMLNAQVADMRTYVGRVEKSNARLKGEIEHLRHELDELRSVPPAPAVADVPLLTPPAVPEENAVLALAAPEAVDAGRFGLAVNILAYELPLGETERRRLETAPSWPEFGRRLVGEVLPVRTSHQTLAKIDAQLGDISGQSLRLIIPELNTRPQPAEAEKVAERMIERGVYGLITALLRPGLRVYGEILRRAEVEVGA